MSNNKPISPQEQQKRVNSWEAIRQDLNKQFRDSGLTERATEESDGELTASIPQGRRPVAPDISERKTHMSNSKPISSQEQTKRIASWEALLQAQDARWRASGLTVEVMEASDGQELTASIPQGKRPRKATRACDSATPHGLQQYANLKKQTAEISKHPFERVARYLVADALVVKAIRCEFGSATDQIIQSIAAGDDPECDDVDLQAFLEELLLNDGRFYRQFTAIGSYGKYPVDIRGLGGVYFYSAPEFGSTGYFLSIVDACEAVQLNWCDSLTSSRGRKFREPFVNQRMLDELASGPAEASRHEALLLLSKPASQEDAEHWNRLLSGAPIRDVELCRRLLKRWFLSTTARLPNDDTWGDTRIFHLTLNDAQGVLKLLAGDGDRKLIESILAYWSNKLLDLEVRQKITRGVARMGLLYSLNFARDLIANIQLAMNPVSEASSTPNQGRSKKSASKPRN
jgi:hypothetical protein